jgi:hypothetical protein
MDSKTQKQNAQNAQALSINLSQKDEIDQKLNYYKSIIKTFADLSEAIDKKLETFTAEDDKNPDKVIEKSRFILEALDIDNRIFSMKGFLEMWLARSADYDKKFAMITAEVNEKFAEVEAKAKHLAKVNIMLLSAMTQYDNLPESEKTQRIKNEYYALIKYEVMKAEGNKEVFDVGQPSPTTMSVVKD